MKIPQKRAALCGFMLFILLGAAGAAFAETYGPIKNGQSLGGVAWELLGSTYPELRGKDINRLLAALWRNNKQAFSHPCNMNTLKSGVLLELPSKDTILSIERKAAREIVVKHQEAFQTARQAKTSLKCLEPDAIAQKQTPEQKPAREEKTSPEAEAPSQKPTEKSAVEQAGGEPAAPSQKTAALGREKKPEKIAAPPPAHPSLEWMEIDTPLQAHWQWRPHPKEATWWQVWPKSYTDPKQSRYNFLAIASKKSSSYRLAFNQLLEVLRQHKFEASITLININKQVELIAPAFTYIKAYDSALVFSMGSESAEYLHNNYRYDSIPIVISTSKDPVLLGLIDNYTSERSSHIAYTSLNVPLNIQMDYLTTLKPSLQAVVLMYNENHKQVVATEVEPTKQAMAERGIEVIDVTVTSRGTAKEELTRQIPEAMRRLKEIDPFQRNVIFWVTSSTAVFTNMKTINQYSENVPVLASIPNAVKEGEDSAVIAIGIDRRSNAHLAALYAVDILRNGVAPGKLPVGIVTPPDIAVNFLVAKRIGLPVPFRFFENANFIYGYDGHVARDFGQVVKR